MTSPTPLLRVQTLHKTYGDQPVLRGLSFEVKAGEVLAVIGGSGSGKTTLLCCLSLLTQPDEGQIDLNGKRFTPSNPADEAAWRQDIGIVFQQFHLWPHKTVLENLTHAPATLGNLTGDEARERAHTWLKRIGLADKAARHPTGLSGGEQQRVALARALMLRPKLLLLDEITSALDPELIGSIQELIRELIQETGLTCILVTHDLNFVRNVASRVLFIDHGQILERGTPDHVLDHPNEERTKQFVQSLRR